MQKILFAFLALIISHAAIAQCSSTFSLSNAPLNNNLLRVLSNNTSTVNNTPPKSTWFSIDWGDNSSPTWTSTNGNQYHNYQAPGTYTVTQIIYVMDSSTFTQCVDTETHNIVVNYPPCGFKVWISTVANAGTFYVTTPVPTTGMTYSWNFGDGNTGIGDTVSHTYTNSGSYTVSCTSTNGNCTYVNTFTVNALSCSSAVSDFDSVWSGAMPPDGIQVNYQANSTNIPGYYRMYDWYFPNNVSILNGSNTEAIMYPTSGNHTVTLVTKWYLGNTLQCLDSGTKSINITGPNIITGYISQDSNSSLHVDSAIYKIWLIVFDSATNTLSAVDSITTPKSPWWSYRPYQFNNKAAGKYRIKAHLTNGPTTGTSYVPTYHYSHLLWSNANVINHTGGYTGYNLITMKTGTATSGPGFVGGNVSMGANKGTAGGIKDMTVLLYDANGNFVKGTITDANGNYTFTNLAPAAYSVHPEDAGYTTTPATITVLNNKPNVTGINFEKSMSAQTITPKATSAGSINANLVQAIYPNPAKDRITIVSKKDIDADVVITDVTGKKVHSSHIETAHAEVVFRNLEPGLYFITVNSDNGTYTQKIVIQ